MIDPSAVPAFAPADITGEAPSPIAEEKAALDDRTTELLAAPTRARPRRAGVKSVAIPSNMALSDLDENLDVKLEPLVATNERAEPAEPEKEPPKRVFVPPKGAVALPGGAALMGELRGRLRSDRTRSVYGAVGDAKYD